jgi:hypothetical protein
MAQVLETFSEWRECWQPWASRIMGRSPTNLGETGIEAATKEGR